MTKFRVGDRVRVISPPEFYEYCANKEGVITGKSKDYDWIVNITDIGSRAFFENELQKIGGSMTKYDELKDRIDRVTGWDKEADDILQEIGEGYALGIMCRDSFFPAVIVIRKSVVDTRAVNTKFLSQDLAQFTYDSQCSKLSSFKQVLMWLLDHSDIKDDKEPLRKELAELKDKIKEIEGKL